MKHTPVLPPRDDSDEELSRVLADMPPVPGIPVTEEEVEAAVARSRAEVAAGRFHRGDLVAEWIATISRPDFKPFEAWLAERDA